MSQAAVRIKHSGATWSWFTQRLWWWQSLLQKGNATEFQEVILTSLKVDQAKLLDAGYRSFLISLSNSLVMRVIEESNSAIFLD